MGCDRIWLRAKTNLTSVEFRSITPRNRVTRFLDSAINELEDAVNPICAECGLCAGKKRVSDAGLLVVENHDELIEALSHGKCRVVATDVFVSDRDLMINITV
jgi:hypothetical protein